MARSPPAAAPRRPRCPWSRRGSPRGRPSPPRSVITRRRSPCASIDFRGSHRCGTEYAEQCRDTNAFARLGAHRDSLVSLLVPGPRAQELLQFRMRPGGARRSPWHRPRRCRSAATRRRCNGLEHSRRRRAGAQSVNLRPLPEALDHEGVGVLPGFTAIDAAGRTVLLGRGGSDLTAPLPLRPSTPSPLTARSADRSTDTSGPPPG